MEYRVHAKYTRKFVRNSVNWLVYTLLNLTADQKAAYQKAKGFKSKEEPGFYIEDANGNPLFMTQFKTLGPSGGTLIVSQATPDAPWRAIADNTDEVFFGAPSWNPGAQQAYAVEEARVKVSAERGLGAFGRGGAARTPVQPAGTPIGEVVNETLHIEPTAEELAAAAGKKEEEPALP